MPCCFSISHALLPRRETQAAASEPLKCQPCSISVGGTPAITTIRRGQMLQAFFPQKEVAKRCAPQILQLVDTASLECARQRLRDRTEYAEAERPVRVRANMLRVPQTASPHCQHSQLESLRSFGQTACACGRIRPVARQLLQKPARGDLLASDG